MKTDFVSEPQGTLMMWRQDETKKDFDHIMEIYVPVDLVVIMLGLNDCKIRFSSHPAWDSALNMTQLAHEAEKLCYGRPGTLSNPKILLIAHATIGKAIADKIKEIL